MPRRLFLVVLCLCVPTLASAHPVPRESHHRALVVRLTPQAVFVSYRVEVDPRWALAELAQIEEVQPELRGELDEDKIYAIYRRHHAGQIAYNLVARLDGRALTFRCVRGSEQLTDSLRCDYLFEATWQPQPGREHQLILIDANYHKDRGELKPALTAGLGVGLRAVKYAPGTDDRLRELSATFELDEPKGVDKLALPPDPASSRTGPRRVVPSHNKPGQGATSIVRAGPGEAKPAHGKRERETVGDASSEEPFPVEAPKPKGKGAGELFRLLLDSRLGFWTLLLLAAGFGAAHALTPGHGKTLVAAYLVGERGTAWHALVLGLVTTLSHTFVVLLLAALLPLFFKGEVPETIQSVLGLVGGLLIAGLGLWLLLCRISGRADHVHLGGGHHHHHHHHHQDPDDGSALKGKTGWWGLIVLGITGGLVPCWDALLMLMFAISAQRLWLALPLLLAFSAGLASVLVALGLLVVHGRNYLGARWGENPRWKRVFAALPVISALVVTLLGLWLCYDSVHGH